MSIDKQQIFEEVQRLFVQRWASVSPFRACVYLTQIGLEVLQRRTNYPAVMQAGTMEWEIVPKHLDDGVRGTHFGFVWSPTDFNSMLSMAQGGIPEMHVWIALPERREIVDFSTGTFPKFVESLGMWWLAPPPPDFLWQDVAQAYNEGHHYAPKAAAIQFLTEHLRLQPL